MQINSLLMKEGFWRNAVKGGGFYDYQTFKLYNLPKIIQRKSKDRGFWLNGLKDGETSHKKENFRVPCVAWVDIDFKRQDQVDDFKRDIPNFKEFIEKLKADDNIFMVGRSLGSKDKNYEPGIRIVGLVDTYYNAYEEHILQNGYDTDLDEEDWLLRCDDIFTLIQLLFQDYLEKNHGLNGGTYMDDCSERISQPTFPINVLYSNTNCNNLYSTYDVNLLNVITKNKYKELDRNILASIALNNNQLIKKIYEKGYDISKLFLTHNAALISIVRFGDDVAKRIWYDLYCKYYQGQSFRPFLRDFNTFSNYLDNQKSLTSCGSLKNMIENS